jgi:hypothetical protein
MRVQLKCHVSKLKIHEKYLFLIKPNCPLVPHMEAHTKLYKTLIKIHLQLHPLTQSHKT